MAFSVHHIGVVPHTSVDGKGGEDVFGPYEPVLGWPQLVEPGMALARAASVVAETPDRVIVGSHFGLVPEPSRTISWGRDLYYDEDGPFGAQFAEIRSPLATHTNHIVIFNRAGELVDSWTWNDHYFAKLDRVLINPYDDDRAVWATDGLKQRLYCFSSDGEESLLEISPDTVGDSEEFTWMGHDVVWLPDGSFYTTGLERIDRFSSDGKHVWSMCGRGDQPKQFHDIHGLVIDIPADRIYVADRGNSRIQVFDLEWNFIDQWPNILAIFSLRLARDGHVWVGDGVTQKFLKYDPNGRLVASWGTFGAAPGCFFGPHWFDVDSEGSLYVAENYNDRVQKLVVRPDVDPDDPRIIGELVP